MWNSSLLLWVQVVVYSERGILKAVLQNETVELETEMVVAIVKDVASALKYLHQLEPYDLARDFTSAGVLLNADYGAQLAHMHVAMVRGSDPLFCISICCCSMINCGSVQARGFGKTLPGFCLP